MTNNNFFSFFPIVTIDSVDLIELTKQFKINIKKFESDRNVFISYVIPDGYRPEDVAQELYSNPQYFWILLLCNTHKDYFYDWPMRDEELRLYADKILLDTIQAVQDTLETGETLAEQFVILYGSTGDTYLEAQESFTNSTYVTLSDENEAKKTIRAINPLRIADFIFQMNKFLK